MKKFHPDMNSGNKKFEEKLKVITLAYTQLKILIEAKLIPNIEPNTRY